jgi:hypothetical protein
MNIRTAGLRGFSCGRDIAPGPKHLFSFSSLTDVFTGNLSFVFVIPAGF